MTPVKKSDRYFFLAFAVYYLITQIIGFTYSSGARIASEGGLPLIAIVHGVFGGLWFLLFNIQILLIRVKNIRLHMTLGKISIPIIIGVFLTGIYAIFRLNTATENISFSLMESEVGLFTLGLIYASLGYIYRKRAHDHKRYYLMSIIMLSPAGVVRFMEFLGYEPTAVIIFFLILFIIPLISIVLYDVFAYKKVFKGTLIGIGLYILNVTAGAYWGKFVVEYVRPYFL